MADVGRPLKFTPEIRAAILECIGNRVPYQLAAEANGISEDTLYHWLRRGSHDSDEGLETDYASFFKSIKKKEMEKITEHQNMINTNPERWQAQSWLLERRWWQHFSHSAPIMEFNKKLDKLLDDQNKDKYREEIEKLKKEKSNGRQET